MKCEDIHEQLLDLAGDSKTPAPEQAQHLAACAPCATKLAELRQTMALLDEWKAPEASPYFDSRLRARMREEAAAPQGWWAALKTPAFLRPMAATAFVLVLAAGIGLYNLGGNAPAGPAVTPEQPVAMVNPTEGSAVADLQALDKNEDVLANFDLLDDLDQQQ